MQTFLVQRTIPAALRPEDAQVVAQHCRWAVDAYRSVGAMWMGGVVTEEAMWSLVAVEAAEDLRRYWRMLGIADEDARMQRVTRAIGPFLATPRP
jgi:hypothetical protein